jgi:hypothetical protein
MSKLARTTVGIAAIAMMLFLWAPSSSADDPKTPPVGHTMVTAVCAVDGTVSFTGTPGVNGHPTKNVYSFDSTSILCVDTTSDDDATVDGTFDVDLMGSTSGVLTTADTGATGETCEEGHSTATATGIATDTAAPHAGDIGDIHVDFERLGGHVIAWGTFDLPTTGHQTFRATLALTPSHLPGEATACSDTSPTGVKITTADLDGEAEVYATTP